MRDNWNKDLPSEGMKPKSIGNVLFLFLAWTAETHSTITVLFILYFVSDPGSESELESESIRSPESEPESESEQPHHDSASLAHTGQLNSEALSSLSAEAGKSLTD